MGFPPVEFAALQNAEALPDPEGAVESNEFAGNVNLSPSNLLVAKFDGAGILGTPHPVAG
jgi:hypothetical protein